MMMILFSLVNSFKVHCLIPSGMLSQQTRESSRINCVLQLPSRVSGSRMNIMKQGRGERGRLVMK